MWFTVTVSSQLVTIFCVIFNCHTHARRARTHTHTFNGPFSGTTQASRYQKGKTNLDFTEARDSEWQWHQLGYMQECTLLKTDNHASTPLLCFLQAGCPSCRPTNSVKALKALIFNCQCVRNKQHLSYIEYIIIIRRHFLRCDTDVVLSFGCRSYRFWRRTKHWKS